MEFETLCTLDEVGERYTSLLADLTDKDDFTPSAPQKMFFVVDNTTDAHHYLIVSGGSFIAARSARRKEFADLGAYRKNVVEIGLVYVVPSQRNTGLACSLLDELKTAIPNTTTDLVVYMQSCVQKPPALRFYKRMGFKVANSVSEIMKTATHHDIDTLIERCTPKEDKEIDYGDLPLAILVSHLCDPPAVPTGPKKRRIILCQPTPLAQSSDIQKRDSADSGGMLPLLRLSTRQLYI
jgi:GNAT superfamily N-acetyltransferase